jgi:hypothetical protein
MQQETKRMLFSGFLATLAIAATACGSGLKFSGSGTPGNHSDLGSEATSGGGTADEGNGGNGPGEDIAESASLDPTEIANSGDLVKAEAALAELCASPAAKDFSQEIAFPQAPQGCDWGKDNAPVDGNLDMLDGRISARREQNVDLSIPKDALICGMAVTFAGQQDQVGQAMYYDDEIYLTFDNLILTGSQKFGLADYFQKKAGFLIWDWTKIVGTPYKTSNGQDSIYCAAATEKDGHCKIPATQTEGIIDLAFSDSLVRKLAIAAGMQFDMATKRALTAESTGGHRFTFVTTGDNDAVIDCKHSNLNMTVKGKFVLPDTAAAP